MLKLFTFMLGCILIAGTALAETNLEYNRSLLANFVKDAQSREIVNALSLNAEGLSLLENTHFAKSASSNDVIENPEGTTRYMIKNCRGYYVNNYGEVEEYGGDFATKFVYGPENEVYMINPLTKAITDTYVRGVIEGNKIEVPLPQTVVWGNMGTDEKPLWGGINLAVMKLTRVTAANGEEVLTYVVDEDKTSVTYTIDDDGTITMENLGYERILGYSSEPGGDWTGYGDKSQSFTSYPRELVTLPEGIQLEDYSFVTPNGGSIVKVGFTDDAVYIADLNPYIPEAVIKADFKDNIASIAQDQFIGMFEDYFIITKCGVFERKGSKKVVFTDGAYDMAFDTEAKQFTATDPDKLLILNAAEDDVLSFYYYQNLSFKYQESMSGIPSNPYGLEFIEDGYGNSDFQFSVSNIATNGNVLDFENLYYSLYIDGEIMEFTSEDGYYAGIPEDEIWDELPLTFINGSDINGNGVTYYVRIYPEGITTIGVQLVYYCGSERTQSDILTLNLETGKVSSSGVENIMAEKEASTTFFDLNGRIVENPSNGIFVKRVIGEDGTVRVSKIICK